MKKKHIIGPCKRERRRYTFFECFENKDSIFHSNNLFRSQTRASQHAQLNEPTCEHTQCSDETHSHEHAQQNVVQHHCHKLPLFSSLSRQRQICDLHKGRIITTIYRLCHFYITLLDSSSDFMVSAMYLTPSMALRTSGFLVMVVW